MVAKKIAYRNTSIENILDYRIQPYTKLTVPHLDTAEGFGASYSPKTYLFPSCFKSNLELQFISTLTRWVKISSRELGATTGTRL